MNTEITHQPKTKLKKSNEWRCECGKLLFKGAFLAGLIEVKCSRCKRMVYLQQFHSYTANHNSFMATATPDGTILTVSQGILDALGYKEENLVGKNFTDFINPKFHTATMFWLDGITRDSGEDNPYTSFILPLVSQSSEERVFSILVKQATLAGQNVYVVVAEAGLESADVHDKEVISKLAKKTRQKRESWDFIVSSTGIITEVSGGSQLGYSHGELLGKPLTNLLESPNEQLLSNLKNQESFVVPLSFRTKDSSLGGYEACFTPDFLAEPGSPAFIVALRPPVAPQSASTSRTSGA